MKKDIKKWDVFISYASEDLKNVAIPLANFLKKLGVSVWFDQFELKIGDSLRGEMDEGLSKCKYGVVILSPSFFKKHYTKLELRGLAQREVDGEKVILPVWYKVNEIDVREYSPSLADCIAAKWEEEGIVGTASKILKVVRPDILENIHEKFPKEVLPRIHSSSELMSLTLGAHFAKYHHEEPKNEEELELVSGFLQEINDWGDIFHELEPGEQIKIEYNFSERIKELESAGWSIYGLKETKKMKVAGIVDNWIMTIIAVLRGEPDQVFKFGKDILVYRKDNTQ